jgi:hypothetical protein
MEAPVRDLTFSTFHGAKNPKATTYTQPWRALASALVSAPEYPEGMVKLKLPAWSPARFEKSRRSKAAAVALDLLVLDYDDGTPIDAARNTWASWAGLLHTSWSHRPDAPKFRVVLPLLEPVPAAEWPRAWRWASEQTGGHIDAACKDPSRIYFMAAIPSGHTAGYHAARWQGEQGWLRIPWEDVPKPGPKLKAAKSPRGTYTRPEGRRRRLQAMMTADVRRALAGELGAVIRGNSAVGVKCPGCGRASVWWLIEPDAWMGARCNHVNSCGWAGRLVEVV